MDFIEFGPWRSRPINPSNSQLKFVFLAARGHYGGYGAPENYSCNFWWKVIIFIILKIFIFEEVHMCENLVDFEKRCKMSIWNFGYKNAKIGVDTVEKEPSKV